MAKLCYTYLLFGCAKHGSAKCARPGEPPEEEKTLYLNDGPMFLTLAVFALAVLWHLARIGTFDRLIHAPRWDHEERPSWCDPAPARPRQTRPPFRAVYREDEMVELGCPYCGCLQHEQVSESGGDPYEISCAHCRRETLVTRDDRLEVGFSTDMAKHCGETHRMRVMRHPRDEENSWNLLVGEYDGEVYSFAGGAR